MIVKFFCQSAHFSNVSQSLKGKNQYHFGGFPGGAVVNNLPARATEDAGLIPGSGRSPGEGNGNRLQHSCLENSMDRGAWQATVHGVAKSQTWLSTTISFWSFVTEWRILQLCIKKRQICFYFTKYEKVSCTSHNRFLDKISKDG